MSAIRNKHITYQGLVIVACLLVAPGAFAAGEGPAIIDRWVAESDAFSFFELSYQGLSYDEATDVTTVTGLKAVFTPELAAPSLDEVDALHVSYTFEAPMLRYTGLTENASSYLAELIIAEEIGFSLSIDDSPNDDSDDGDGTVPGGETRGSYNGMVVRGAKWAKLPDIVNDPKKPISKYYPFFAALADVNFGSFAIAGAQSAQQLDDDTLLISEYGPMVAGEVKASNFSSVTVDGMTIRTAARPDSDQTDAEPFDLTITRLESKGYNIGTFLRQFDPDLPASQRDTPFKPLLDRFAVLGSKLSGREGMTVTLDEVSYTDIGIRPSAQPLLAQADEFYLKAAEEGSEPEDETIVRAVASLYSMFRLGAFEMSGLKLDDIEAEDLTKITAELDNFRIADLWSGGLGELSAKGLNVERFGDAVRTDVFQIRDVGFPTLDALLDAERAYEENDIRAIIAALPTLGLIEFLGVDINVVGGTRLKMDVNRLEMANFIERIPTKVTSTLENLQIAVASLEEGSRQIFERMGYERLNVSYSLSLVWNEAREVLSLISRNALEDGGSLDADLEIGGIPRSVFENPETAQNVLALLTFNAASVVFDDNSLLDRAVTAAAEQQGKAPDQLKQEVVGALPFLLGALNKPDFVENVGTVVAKLLDEGGALKATAKPGAPVSMMQVIAGGATAPGTLIDLLEIEVTAE
uniref:hypothetical protein n=1 Tax=Pararhizobium sp. IMCC3301 TaxID=3067904 RepID=UPI002740ACED|nr:hypothetical protein [Pararhizobium sp. IMCC3301]